MIFNRLPFDEYTGGVDPWLIAKCQMIRQWVGTLYVAFDVNVRIVPKKAIYYMNHSS